MPDLWSAEGRTKWAIVPAWKAMLSEDACERMEPRCGGWHPLGRETARRVARVTTECFRVLCQEDSARLFSVVPGRGRGCKVKHKKGGMNTTKNFEHDRALEQAAQKLWSLSLKRFRTHLDT